MPPGPLPPQSQEVMNATTDPERCVQFTLAPYGVHNAYLGPGSPGTEDCLKLYVWKPTKAKRGDNLSVLVYVHVSRYMCFKLRLSINPPAGWWTHIWRWVPR